MSIFKQTRLCAGLMLAFGGLAVVSTSALAQDATLQRVEITGSHIKRIQAEGPLPVGVITRAEIERKGVTSTNELLGSGRG